MDTTETVDAPVETADVAADTGGAVEAAPVESEPVEAAPAEPESPFPWDGELNSINDAEWFNGLDERIKATVLNGLENKHRNWSRGWTKSYQENADQRKDLERRAEAVRQSEIRVQKWLHGDVDPLDEKQKEIDDLKQAHEAAIRAIREEHELRLGKHDTRSAEELEKTRQELLTHKKQLERYAQAERQRHEAQRAAYEQEIDSKAGQFQQWLQNNEPHIYANDDAFESLCTMMASGFSLKDSLTFVHAKFPAPQPAPEPEPEAVPDGVKLMNMGSGSGTVSGESRSYDEIMDAMRRSAMQGTGGILGH